MDILGGGTASISGNTFTSNQIDLLIEATAGLITIGDGNAFTGSLYDIENLSSENFDLSGYTTTTFGGFNAATSTVAGNLASFYAVEDKLVDAIDSSGLGFIRIHAGDVFVASSSEAYSSGAIQRTVNVANSGDTIYVQAGTYVGNVTINQPVALLGPNALVAGNGSRGTEATLEPGMSGADPYITATPSILIEVLASNVTVQGFTLTGQNDALGTGNGVALTETGTPIYAQAAEAIASYNPTHGTDLSSYGTIPTYANPSNVVIQNNIIENVSYEGVDIGWDSNGTPTGGNVIAHNLIQNIGPYNDEGSGIRLYNNVYADVTNNQLLNVRMGVEVGNFSQARPLSATTGSIENNEIETRRRGIFYNLSYGTSTALPVEFNTITAATDDPAIVSGSSLWTGIYVISQQGTVAGTFQDNSIDGSGSSYATTAGYTVLSTDATSSVVISGDASALNRIQNVSYGVWETNAAPNGFGAADANMGVTVSGLNISASTYGVYVNYDVSNGYSVAATINGGTQITVPGGIGILVSGAHASANISGVTINDPTTGIEINGGSATISGNTIENNNTGIDILGGGTASISGNTFTSNQIDLLIEATAGLITIGDGNAFTGSLYDIENLSSENFDLSGYTTTTFGGFNAATSTVAGNLASFYAVEDKLVDAIDSSGLGFIRIHADDVFVASSSEAYSSGAIQRTVNVANSGDTIYVQAGTYVGNVTINQPLALDGPFASTAGFGVGRGTGEAVVEPASGSSYLTGNVITVEASNVTIAGLTTTEPTRRSAVRARSSTMAPGRKPVTAFPTRSGWTITPRCPPPLTLFPTLR